MTNNSVEVNHLHKIPAHPVLTAILSGSLSGIAVSLLTFFLSRRKMDAEIDNLKIQTQKTALEMTNVGAQADKARAEIENLMALKDKTRAETDQILKNMSAAVNYTLTSSAEEILVDGKNGLTGFDVKGSKGQFWSGNNVPTSPLGEGQLTFDDGTLNIQRTNTEGRFEILFQRYMYKGTERTFIPKDDLVAGKRKLLVSCEAKSIGGEHSLRFVVRNPVSGGRLAQEVVKVSGNSWMPYQVFLPSDPTVDCQFRIDDEEVTSVPSSVQIRNIVLAQRK